MSYLMQGQEKRIESLEHSLNALKYAVNNHSLHNIAANVGGHQESSSVKVVADDHLTLKTNDPNERSGNITPPNNTTDLVIIGVDDEDDLCTPKLGLACGMQLGTEVPPPTVKKGKTPSTGTPAAGKTVYGTPCYDTMSKKRGRSPRMVALVDLFGDEDHSTPAKAKTGRSQPVKSMKRGQVFPKTRVSYGSYPNLMF